jgi:opacity protein-like surface antigen
MKAFLLGFFAFYALLGAAHARDTYAGVYGGANWNDVLTHPKVNTQRGVVVGAVLGTDVPAVPGLYVEADISVRHNEVNVGPFGPLTIAADHDTTAVLANVVYSPDIGLDRFKPYGLVGVGVAHTEGTFEDLHVLKVEASGLAYQAGFGVAARVAEGVTMSAGYRYLSGPELVVLGTQLSDGTNHAVVAELRVAL